MFLKLSEETKLCLEIMIIYFADVVFTRRVFCRLHRVIWIENLKSSFLALEKFLLTIE